jgi:hypothetical protein
MVNWKSIMNLESCFNNKKFRARLKLLSTILVVDEKIIEEMKKGVNCENG